MFVSRYSEGNDCYGNLHQPLVSLTNSSFHTECYLKQGCGLNNDTAFVYSELESNISVTCASIISILGFSLNFMVIVALFKTPKLRREDFSPYIVSLALNDTVFSLFVLPINAARFYYR